MAKQSAGARDGRSAEHRRAPYTPRRVVYDAIVVGSGMTGGWAAKELTENGLQTLVLEAGPNVEPRRDYTEHVPPWEMTYRGWGNRKELEANQPVQRTCYACDELGHSFFVNDNENPYIQPDDAPFLWIRGRQVGGRSIMWGRHSYRMSDLDFEANAKDGHGVDWPIRYADLAPWYDYVESYIGLSGQAEGMPQLPDGQFMPPLPFNCAEEHVRERLMQLHGGTRVLTMGRAAVLTRNHRGRRACHFCGPCERGCVTRSYFSSLNATLPAAEATGRMTLRPNSVVESLVYDSTSARVRGVRVIDRVSGEVLEFEGRVVFLAASALESARLLLNSTSTDFPDGLANSSGVVGRYLMDHHMGAGARGRFDEWAQKEPFGRRPNGIYLMRFRNVTDQHPDFVRGYAYQGGGYRPGWGRGVTEPGFGAEFKRRMADPGPWMFSLYGFGTCLPHVDNYIELDPVVKDAWGIPVLRVNCRWRENELAMRPDMQIQAAEMLEASGAKDVVTYDEDNAPGLTIHEMGTARMGRDPRSSVLNAHNQTWDVPNLFVVDGACMTSSANQNPSLTYMALTARACDHAVNAMRRGEL